MKVYFISGLAADKRIFKHIKLPPGFEIVYLDWISPTKDESLESYSVRLAGKIDPKEKFALVGLSMGGMIASEIAKKYKPIVTILISSAATYKQFPPRLKIAYFTRLHKIVPTSFLKSASIMKLLFSTEDAQDKIVLKQLIKDSDKEFIRWAVNAILKWKNEDTPHSLFHIHGSNDRVLPIRFTNPTHIIHKGDHRMVMSRATELNEILGKIVSFSSRIQ